MKIAIIGSGISGNTIAHLLYKDHDIQVFENDSRIGGHSHTHNISVEENKKITVDTGFIVFNKEGEECFSFGKHKGKTVESVLENEPGYFGWLLNADFPMYTKKVLTAIRLRKLNT